MKKALIIFFLPVLLLGLDSADLFERANKNAEDSKFLEAIEKYELLVEKGFISGNLYYNLGNAYYRTNQLGFALWAYYSAQRLIPRDPDLLHNIKVAQAKCVDRIELPKSIFLFDFLLKIETFVRLVELNILGSILFFIISLLILLKKTDLVSINIINYLVSLLVTLFLIVNVLALRKYIIENKEKYSIVISNSVSVFSGPKDNQNSILFLVNEGLKVKLNNYQEKWVEIELIDGKKGWVNILSVKEI
tara:strand:+ start:113 stop:856 length:744 start_codon:yes stop_codon:yes gene_type:complete